MAAIRNTDGLPVSSTLVRCCAAFLLALLLMPRSVSAEPSIIVGDSFPESCTEDAFRGAVTHAETLGGGVIRFDCGKSPVTITLHPLVAPTPPPPCTSITEFTLPNDTTIDGGGLITLAQSSVPCDRINMFLVGSSVTATMKNLTLLSPVNSSLHVSIAITVQSQGAFTASNVTFTGLGWALANSGTATLEKSTIQQSGDKDYQEGPLENFNGGHLAIDQCAFTNNVGFGVIRNVAGGTIDIANSLFQSNSTGVPPAGGAILNDGEANIKNSTFSGNTANGGGGGAISNGGTMTIKNSVLSENESVGFGQPFRSGGGGGLYNTGILTIKNSTVSENRAAPLSGLSSPVNGGGLFNAGSATVMNSRFSGNQASGSGGGIYNSGDSGGGSLELRNSRITSNAATVDGGGIYLSSTSPSPTLINTRVVDNTPNDIAP